MLQHTTEHLLEGNCETALEDAIGQLTAAAGAPDSARTLRRGGSGYQLLSWGNCGSAACRQAQLGCNRQGLLEVEVTISDYSLQERR